MPDIPASAEVLTFELDACRGRYAVLLVFAPSARSPTYEMQMELLQAMEERLRAAELLVVHLLAEGESYLNDRRIDPASVRRLQEQYGVGPDDFRLVAVDREGRDKAWADTAVKPEAVFDFLGLS